ncbi:MAG: hypothetical protein M3033_16980 [Acidobacteriota bacterium]|nr:hypothetical protein [Acidobacteriota bacterium]
MKRIQEKVKDLVEVRSYKSLQDLIAEPSQTLAIYHFTDITSDLMAKYIDKVAAVQSGSGMATALAGYRGVGKTHFLATLGAIVSHPELRSKVSDPHVATSSQHLKRARYPVAYVRRGTHETLIEELKDAIAIAFDIDVNILGDSVSELLSFAAEKAGEMPFVLIVDTAFERASRVARDDGVLLGEIAETAKTLNVFVAAALDDDIAGADGINSAIVRSFTIDFLDQEHLYRIVDSHLFPKNRQFLPVLHDIYANFKEVLPNFRWSEQRFSALYPLHPIILEIAPFIRLYAPEFTLLGFAAEAGGKILARPANSLIGLDEVFDTIEHSFRKIDDLKDVFATYDKINKDIIGQISVMQRLQAKLVLKALFLLSLEGEGTTAGEIAAAMLIYDENDSQKSVNAVEDLLGNFAAAFPSEIQRTTVEGKENRYALKVTSKDHLNSALAEVIKTVSPVVIPKVLRRAARERFSDWTYSEENEAQNQDVMESSVVWRGSIRRGRVIWDLEDKNAVEQTPAASELFDWEIIVSHTPEAVPNNNDSSATPKIYWQPAPLKKDEAETVLRYYALLTDKNLRDEYGEQLRAASHSHILAVEKIWNRIFLEDAKIFLDGAEHQLPDEARGSETLGQMLSNILEPVFDARYPNHPFFMQTLTAAEVSELVSDFFSGARQNVAQTQQMAEVFALPLGLVKLNGNAYFIEGEEHFSTMALTSEVLALVRANPEKTVSLHTIYEKLKQPPFGLVSEAQHLILTALVAQRMIEFVTSKGDRINRRSLDLKIIWDDIEGVAKPSSVVYSNERLTEWARILTSSDVFRSLDTIEERSLVRSALESWLGDWQMTQILQRFNQLPDGILNTKIWRLATHAEKTFGSVAQTVASISDESISLEEGLHRIADAFSDSEKEFLSCTKDLVVLEDFINGVPTRQEIWNYLAVCENTQDEKIENLRQQLSSVVEESYVSPNETLNRRMKELWEEFFARFTEYFAQRHDTVMKSHHLQGRFDEILGSDSWWEFENLSRLPIFQKNYWKQAQNILRQSKELDCRFEVTEMLKMHPFCACSFNLKNSREWENLPAAFEETIARGRKSYMKILRLLCQTLFPLIESFSKKHNENEFTVAALHLTGILKGNNEPPPLTNNELIVLQKAFELLPASPLLNLDLALNEDYMSGEDLRVKITAWLDELPSEPVLVKI